MIHLEQALHDAISESISEVHKVAVAFSSGVDNSLLARISDHHLKKQGTLVPVGFSGSHDLIFSESLFKNGDRV